MLDRIRKEIEDRLKEVRAEEQELLRVLKALGQHSGETAKATSTARSSPSRATSGRKTAAAKPASTKRASTKPLRTASTAAAKSTSSRPARGATKASVLEALTDGNPKTAGEVATASGLGRGSVSTTLSKLAKSGEVVKADRGYRLPT